MLETGGKEGVTENFSRDLEVHHPYVYRGGWMVLKTLYKHSNKIKKLCIFKLVHAAFQLFVLDEEFLGGGCAPYGAENSVGNGN